MSETSASYKRHRFPPALIAHAVWLYLRFCLSLRAVEELLLERGVEVSYESPAPMGREVRPRDRPRAAAPATLFRPHLAPRRGASLDRGPALLALAGRR